MERDTCVFASLDDKWSEFDSNHFAVIQLEPGVSALRKAGVEREDEEPDEDE